MGRLADVYLPEFQFAERHEGVAMASPRQILAVIPTLSVSDDAALRALIALRETPARLLGRKRDAPFGMDRFTKLGESGTEIAFGLCGRFWRADYGLVSIRDAAAYRAFAAPGVPKLLMSFDLEATAGGTKILTETRVHCPDADAYRAFAPYWFAIRLGSGFIRRRMLGVISRRARLA